MSPLGPCIGPTLLNLVPSHTHKLPAIMYPSPIPLPAVGNELSLSFEPLIVTEVPSFPVSPLSPLSPFAPVNP